MARALASLTTKKFKSLKKSMRILYDVLHQRFKNSKGKGKEVKKKYLIKLTNSKKLQENF